MITDQTSPEDFANKRRGNHNHIKGWGVDINPDNDPTYPIKKRNDEEHKDYTWERPDQQEDTTEILQSVERPNLKAVYGTSMPPSGISGIIRRLAYKFSESSYGRWLPLIIADRIDVLEGILTDLSNGRIPNIPKEIGLKSEWKYNRKEFLVNVAVGVIITGALLTLFLSSDKKSKQVES